MKRKDIGAGIPLAKLAQQISVTLVGNANRLIKGLSPLEDPIAGCISFYNGKNFQKLAQLLISSELEAVIVTQGAAIDKLPGNISYLMSADPMRSFVDIVSLFYEPYPLSNKISSLASVHPSCLIGKNVSVAEFVSIGPNCKIGDNVVIHPNVTIYPEVIIGAGSVIHAGVTIRERCTVGAASIIHCGAIIGSDGFGYIPDDQIGIRAVPQVGTTVIAPHVEVGANTCIDRAAFGETTIGTGSKLDNLVQIGHNVKVGNYSLLCAHTAIAGSAEIGNHVTMGGNTAVSNRVKIGDGIRVAGQSAVTSSLSEKGDYGGFPASPISHWRRQVAAIKKLPELLKQLRKEKSQFDHPKDANE